MSDFRELHGRDVDADADLAALRQPRLPDLDLAARLGEHPPSQWNNLPRLLGDRDELRRRDQAALRVLPADQRLDAEQIARVQFDDRLVVQQELALDQRFVEFARHFAPFARRMLHGRLEHDVTALACGFRRVHGDVGVAHQILDAVVGG